MGEIEGKRAEATVASCVVFPEPGGGKKRDSVLPYTLLYVMCLGHGTQFFGQTLFQVIL